jgi:hypothetical protein
MGENVAAGSSDEPSGKLSHNGQESAGIKVEKYQKSAPLVILSAGETFGRVTAR